MFIPTPPDNQDVTESTTRELNVRAYGAVGDGESLDTDAIQEALDECAERGGTVRVPPGTYRTAPLRVSDDTSLHLDADARLQFVRDFRAFPTVRSRWEGWNQYGFHPCLFVKEAENVEITGRGTIDGRGSYWWNLVDQMKNPESYKSFSDEYDAVRERIAEIHERNDKQDDVSDFTIRPPLLQISGSENVTVSGVELTNSPFWNTHVVYSEDVTITDVTVDNPTDAPNGDGIDIDSSSFVRISDTFIDAGDDAICIKSGKDEEGRTVGEPARNIAITNCTIEHGHGGVVIGSEMSGDVRDVVVSNCTFTDTDRGVRIKTTRGRGGAVEDLRFDNIVMRRVVCPFTINGYYFTDIESEPEPVTEETPMVRNVSFQHITAREAGYAGFLAGLPERAFEGISFHDVTMDVVRPLPDPDISPAMADNYDASPGLFCKSMADVSFTDVQVRTPHGPAFQFEETADVTLDGVRVSEEQETPVVTTTGVDGLRVRGCEPPATGTFLRARETSDVRLAGNYGGLEEHVDADEPADRD